MRHKVTTSYGQSINERILVIHDAAGSTAPAATGAWVTSIGTLGGTKALHVVARNPVVKWPRPVYRLDDTTTGRAFECLDHGHAALDIKTGVAVTRAPKHLRPGDGDACAMTRP